jgi:hypothetical protein
MRVLYDSSDLTIRVDSGFNSFTRSVARISSIHIHGMQGNDTISVDSALPVPMWYVIDGGPGDDTLRMVGGAFADTMTLDSATTATINGTPITFASIASITMSGLHSAATFNIAELPGDISLNIDAGQHDDTLYLAPNNPVGIGVLRGPITINGSTGADTLNVGSGGLSAVSGLVTFNAGALNEENSLNLDDDANVFQFDYAISNSSITRSSFGGVNYSGVDRVKLDCSQGANTVRINARDAKSVDVNGNSSGDHIIIDNPGVTTAVRADGGDGGDEITLDDHANPAAINWLLANSNVFPGDRYVRTAYFETVNCLAGSGVNEIRLVGELYQSFHVDAGGGNDVFKFDGTTFGAPAIINGGGGADTFN